MDLSNMACCVLELPLSTYNRWEVVKNKKDSNLKKSGKNNSVMFNNDVLIASTSAMNDDLMTPVIILYSVYLLPTEPTTLPFVMLSPGCCLIDLNTVALLYLTSIQETLFCCMHRQYASGEHCSTPRRIFGSIVPAACTDSGNDIKLLHFVYDGSSQWVIGKNVTTTANISYLITNALQSVSDYDIDHFKTVNFGLLSHIPLSILVQQKNAIWERLRTTALNGAILL